MSASAKVIGSWAVESASRPGAFHNVTLDADGALACSCAATIELCRHIRVARRAAAIVYGAHLLVAARVYRWSTKIDARPKRRLGQCRYHRREIGISAWLVASAAPWSEVVDTIRHEVAHAVTGPGHHHDAHWKKIAAELGARPERCAPRGVVDDHLPRGRWAVTCPCGVIDQRRHRGPNRRPGTTYTCRHCGGLINWSRT